MRKLMLSVVFFFAITSCGDNKTTSNPDAYTMMETAFEGSPSKSEIQPMMQKVMKMYGYEETEENLQKFGSVLVTLRKQSVVGVTEMEILKNIYQKGNTNITFEQQATFSFMELESKK